MGSFFPSEGLLIESNELQVALSKTDGSWKILHKPVNVVWFSSNKRFCQLKLYNSETGMQQIFRVDNLREIRKDDHSIILAYTPTDGIKITFKVELLDSKTVRLSYTPEITDTKWSVHSVSILDEALTIVGENAYAIVPSGPGLAVPANSPAFTLDAGGKGTYNYLHRYNMALLGLVIGASSMAITWTSPDVDIKLEGNGNAITTTITLSRTEAKEINLHFIANGDYVDIAKYYRSVVMEQELFVPLVDKIAAVPTIGKLIGAVQFRPSLKLALSNGALDGLVDSYHSFGIDIERDESIVYWTFDEMAHIAEHLKNDLKIDRALIGLVGWMNGGHDLYYPDFLPADAELGGNSGLADLSARIRSLGYLFSLWTNYNLLFESAPSTDPMDSLMDAENSKARVYWAGGPAYTACPARQSRYAQMTMPEIQKLFSPNAAFLDQTMAVDLYECYDTQHPLTRTETIEAYRSLVNYVKSVVRGPVGSENGYEWGMPFFDIFEGILTYPPGAHRVRIPLFELVYRECGAFFTWFGDMVYVTPEPLHPHRVDVLDLIIIGRTPIFHLPPHLYYKTEGTYRTDDPYARADNGWAQDLCTTDGLIKNVYEITSPLNELTILSEMSDHKFLTADRNVEKTVFATNTTVVINRGHSEFVYNDVVLPWRGFLVNSPVFEAFYANSYNGINYSNPVLFAIRSFDGKDIRHSERIRIYHGFGDTRIAIKNIHAFARVDGKVFKRTGDFFVLNIEREATVEFYT